VTTPRINTIKRGGSRLYVHPESAEKVPGVTSILNMLPKGFLKFWASKSAAEYAVNNLGAVVSLAMNDTSAAVDLIKRAPDRDTAQAAEGGTEVHDLFERMAKGEEVGRIHPDLKPYVGIFKGFEKTYEPEFLFLEETVWSETHGYAGSFDFIAKVTDPDTAERMTVVGDWKTTRSGVHAEVALQETAYSRADYIILPDGSKAEIPALDAGIVVHARPEGGQVVPALLSDDLFEIFLALRQVWEWDREVSKSVLGRGLPIEAVVEETRSRRTRSAR
jgi:hypothetical protein